MNGERQSLKEAFIIHHHASCFSLSLCVAPSGEHFRAEWLAP
jgi:hypothetical protein